MYEIATRQNNPFIHGELANISNGLLGKFCAEKKREMWLSFFIFFLNKNILFFPKEKEEKHLDQLNQ